LQRRLAHGRGIANIDSQPRFSSKTLTEPAFPSRRRPFVLRLARLTPVAAVMALVACSGGLPKPELGFGQTTQHGYVVSPDALQQVPVGSSKDQVLIALGSPST